MKLKHNCQIILSEGLNRESKKWKNKALSWLEFLKRIEKPARTTETFDQYQKLSKKECDRIKDVGGFVGGHIQGGRRKKGAVLFRTMLTLDIDKGFEGLWELFTLNYGQAAAIYSTHSHSSKAPRYRLIMPLDREVDPEEYQAIGRRIAGDLDIEAFDNTGFQPERLMYWPSCSTDGEYVFKYQDGEILNADEVLGTYYEWSDSSTWPVSANVKALVTKGIKKQENPHDKPGIVGAFCRAYDIHEAISTFLGDVYDSCNVDGRYTYKGGSTTAGLVTYDDMFAFSHHGTDPIEGMLCNSFDIVRIHLYGQLDEEASDKTNITKMPSFIAMRKLAMKQKKVRGIIGKEKLDSAKEEFKEAGIDIEEVESNWLESLDVTEKGEFKNTIDNICKILENDEMLKGRFAFDDFHKNGVSKIPFPWNSDPGWINDADIAAVRRHIEKAYNVYSPGKLDDAVIVVSLKNKFHPVKDYLNSLEWDGQNRLDSLLIDFMGAEDNEYTRAVTRKAFVAAVARIFQPGIKFDYMLTLVGEQGTRKSMLVDIMGGEWYNDSFTFSMIGKKEAVEQITGSWLVEVGELAGMRKGDKEQIKRFVAARKDEQRNAFMRKKEIFKRQNIFIGNCNDKTPFKDETGARRFWPVEVTKLLRLKELKRLRGQLWAEAVEFYNAGEKLYLSDSLEQHAKEMQSQYTEKDSRREEVIKYIDTPVPENWAKMTIWERREFMQGDPLQVKGTGLRKRISVTEIWTELLGGQLKDLDKSRARELNDLMRSIPGWQYKLYREGETVYRGFERIPISLKGDLIEL